MKLVEVVSKEEVLSAIDKLAGTRASILGDFMLDRYIWGQVNRISPEAPVPVVHVSQIDERLGGAGNTVRNLCSLGAEVSVSGLVGDDPEGRVILELLSEAGVKKDGVLVDRAFPTSLKTRVIAHKQQVVRIDREDLGERSASLIQALISILESELEAVDVLLLSDYGKGTITQKILARLSELYNEGKFGADSCPVVLDPHPVNYTNYHGITVAKPNRAEAEKATGITIADIETGGEAARILRDMWRTDMLILSLGGDGLLFSSEGADDVHVEANKRDAYDVTGAGDTLTAVFSLALAAKVPPLVAACLSNIGAGLVVAEVGAVAVSLDDLRDETKKLFG